jgi:hypothetical protein
MMANASKDPFWQAKVSAEVAANPHLKEIIEDKCLTCHSPLGRTEAISNGATGYTIAEMLADPLAMDGVSCTSCHQIIDVNLGEKASFSGNYAIENNRLIYGPFQSPFTMPMQMRVNYTPTFGEHVHDSEICATCHTLFTPFVDNNGEIVGEAPEQTPYLEWKNSNYPDQDIQCQGCDMPEVEEPVIISNMPMMLSGRAPYAKHYFVGGNVFMLRLLRDNATDIGVSATTAQFDSTIARSLRLLQTETVDLEADYSWQNDSLEVQVAVKNLTGHKFPTAYPSRRAWLLFRVTNNNQQILFESGTWDRETGEIIGLDEPYEIHYDYITQSGQVQVYQSIMKDVDDNVNYTLLRAAGYIKDNRIPPAGFTTEHPDYEHTVITGGAISDTNFNRNGATQGTGIDSVYYRIGDLDKSPGFTIDVKLLYQSLEPRFVTDLLRYETPEVSMFENYYNQADKSPVVVDSLQLVLMTTGTKESQITVPESPILMSVYPNPFNPETTIEFELFQTGKTHFTIYNALGVRVRTISSDAEVPGKYRLSWNANDDYGQPVPSGVYFLSVRFIAMETNRISTQSHKVLFLK